MSGPTAALVRAPRQPCRAHTAVTVTRRAFRAISTQARAAGAQRTPQRVDSSRAASQTIERRRRLPSAYSTAVVAAAAAVLHASTLTAFAEDAQPLAAPVPSLPTPPEVVQTLSETIFSGPDVDTQEAPALKDEQQSGSSGNGNGGSPEKQQNGAAKQQGGQPKQQDTSKDEQLQKRFENDILPKIQEQLKALDQNEAPNATTIELKRQLRRAEDDIYRLLEDLKERKSDAAQAEASGLAREFEDIRSYVKENGGQLADEEKGS